MTGAARDGAWRPRKELAFVAGFWRIERRNSLPIIARGRAHMNRRRKIYEGKAKVLYEGPEPGTLIQYFKDDATAGNGAKHEIIDGKGVLNNRISEYIFTKLNGLGIPTHFIRRLNMREQLIKEVEIIPLEVVVRNVAAGSLAKRLGLEPGTQLPRSIIEFYYKDDALDDPMVSEEHITAFGWATPAGTRRHHGARHPRQRLPHRPVHGRRHPARRLQDRSAAGSTRATLMRIVLADEISARQLPAVGHQDPQQAGQGSLPPRTSAVLVDAYREVAQRLGILVETDNALTTGPRLVQ